MNWSILAGLPDPRSCICSFLGAQTVPKEMDTGAMQNWDLSSPSIQSMADFQTHPHEKQVRSDKGFFGPTKIHKGYKWVFWRFQLMLFGHTAPVFWWLAVSDISSPFSAAQVNLVAGMVGGTGKELQAIFLLFSSLIRSERMGAEGQ